MIGPRLSSWPIKSKQDSGHERARRRSSDDDRPALRARNLHRCVTIYPPLPSRHVAHERTTRGRLQQCAKAACAPFLGFVSARAGRYRGDTPRRRGSPGHENTMRTVGRVSHRRSSNSVRDRVPFVARQSKKAKTRRVTSFARTRIRGNRGMRDGSVRNIGGEGRGRSRQNVRVNSPTEIRRHGR